MTPNEGLDHLQMNFTGLPYFGYVENFVADSRMGETLF